MEPTSQNITRAFRVDFTYTEQAAIHIAAQTEAEASAGAVAMLSSRVKNVAVVSVTDVTEPSPDDDTSLPITEQKKVLN